MNRLLKQKIVCTKKGLAIALSGLKGFRTRKEALEQREIPSEIIADALWNAYMLGDIQDRIIADLGCGPGAIGIGALLLGAKKVYFVDVDEDAIRVLTENLSKFNIAEEKFEILHTDVRAFNQKVDVVIQNPPFGVRKRIDRVFLEAAFDVAPTIYSFHRLDFERFVRAFSADHGYDVTHIWKYKWPMPAILPKHRKRLRYLDVGCWRLKKIN